MECLLASVFFERHAIFDAGRKAFYSWDGFERDPAGGRRRAKLAKFTGIGGSEEKLVRGQLSVVLCPQL